MPSQSENLVHVDHNAKCLTAAANVFPQIEIGLFKMYIALLYWDRLLSGAYQMLRGISL